MKTVSSSLPSIPPQAIAELDQIELRWNRMDRQPVLALGHLGIVEPIGVNFGY